MPKLLHLLRSAPDDTVAELIAAMSGQEGATVMSLYQDDIAGTCVDWERLVADIMAHEKNISWW
jgi:hypothetical protein